MYQYRCACCNQVLSSTDKSCPNCGSHNIRSPFGFWFFCVMTCFVVAIGVMAGKLYLKQNQDEIEPKKAITDFLQSKKITESN